MAILRNVLALNLALTSPAAPSGSVEHGSLFRVRDGGRAGYVDARGRTVIKPQLDDSWGFTEGLAPVLVNGRYGFIDTNGKLHELGHQMGKFGPDAGDPKANPANTAAVKEACF